MFSKLVCRSAFNLAHSTLSFVYLMSKSALRFSFPAYARECSPANGARGSHITWVKIEIDRREDEKSDQLCSNIERKAFCPSKNCTKVRKIISPKTFLTEKCRVTASPNWSNCTKRETPKNAKSGRDAKIEKPNRDKVRKKFGSIPTSPIRKKSRTRRLSDRQMSIKWRSAILKFLRRTVPVVTRSWPVTRSSHLPHQPHCPKLRARKFPVPWRGWKNSGTDSMDRDGREFYFLNRNFWPSCATTLLTLFCKIFDATRNDPVFCFRMETENREPKTQPTEMLTETPKKNERRKSKRLSLADALKIGPVSFKDF